MKIFSVYKNMADPIGNLNGKWGVLFKILLGTYPFVIMWGGWVTKSVFETRADLDSFASAGDRFSLQDAYSLERRIDQKIDTLPPEEWKIKVNAIERENYTLREENRKLQLYLVDKIADFRDEFTKEFVRKDEHNH